VDEHIQHDPRTKQMIKDLLYAFLYSPVLKQYEKQLDSLIIKNALMIGAGHKSFTYKGEFYTCDDTAPPRKMNRLDPRLKDDMEQYLKDIAQLNKYELPYVLGFINQVLNASNNLSDYLTVFPQAIHRPIEKLIESCPCRACNFSKETQTELVSKNKTAIDLLKKRLMVNLII